MRRRRCGLAAVLALAAVTAPALAACGVYAPPIRPSQREPEPTAAAATAAAPAPDDEAKPRESDADER